MGCERLETAYDAALRAYDAKRAECAESVVRPGDTLHDIVDDLPTTERIALEFLLYSEPLDRVTVRFGARGAAEARERLRTLERLRAALDELRRCEQDLVRLERARERAFSAWIDCVVEELTSSELCSAGLPTEEPREPPEDLEETEDLLAELEGAFADIDEALPHAEEILAARAELEGSVEGLGGGDDGWV